jgi:hypothetical protein
VQVVQFGSWIKPRQQIVRNLFVNLLFTLTNGTQGAALADTLPQLVCRFAILSPAATSPFGGKSAACSRPSTIQSAEGRAFDFICF